jgi:hypothetical protein
LEKVPTLPTEVSKLLRVFLIFGKSIGASFEVQEKRFAD